MANNIIFLDTDEANIERCKSILETVDLEGEIFYTTFPEQAISWLSEKEVSVFITESNLDIMSVEEISDMISIIHPDIVLLLMTEVSSSETIIDVLNNTSIYELILKPIQFTEDIEVPIQRAQKEHERRVSSNHTLNTYKKTIEKTKKEIENLQTILKKKNTNYSNIYHAILGIVKGNISLHSSMLEGIHSEAFDSFYQALLKEYMQTFLLPSNDLHIFYQQLIHLFQDDITRRTINLEEKLFSNLSLTTAKDLYYAIFLIFMYCKSTLGSYEGNVVLNENESFYELMIQFLLENSMLNNEIVYVEGHETIRHSMLHLTRNCYQIIYSSVALEETPTVITLKLSLSK